MYINSANNKHRKIPEKMNTKGLTITISRK